jgi:hypothetical protein
MCFGPRTEAAGLTGTTWPITSLIEQMVDRGEPLLHRRSRGGLRLRLELGCDVQRLHIAE